MNIPLIKLDSGQTIPQIGLGTFAIENDFLVNIILKAYELGYRHFDTAQLYLNEEIIGLALKKLFDKGVKREELFITTKYLPYKNTNAKDKLKESLQKLQLNYVDMYLLHWTHAPLKIDDQGHYKEWQHHPIHKVWPIFEECNKNGLTKGIGVSNFNCQSLIDLLSYCSIRPSINQIEVHPYLIQKGLVNFCQQFGIQIIAYSPIVCKARGGLQSKTTLTSGKKVDVFNEPLLIKISTLHKKSVAQICLKYLLQRGIIIIPKTEKFERLIENISILDFQLNSEEINEVESLNCNFRTVNPLDWDWWGNLNVFD